MTLPALPDRDEPEDILGRYLPGILRDDPFLSRLLRLFDSQLRPVIETIDALEAYFDPALAPRALLPWLAAWVGEEIDGVPGEASQRALISQAAELHRRRGTRSGLRQALELLTGKGVLIVENTAGLRLDEDARLGLNTTLEPFEPHRIQIMLPHPLSEAELEEVAEALRKLKPAHCTVFLRSVEA